MAIILFALVYPVCDYPDGKNCNVDELVKHALKALSGCVTGDKELDAQGATVAIVGKVSASGSCQIAVDRAIMV